MYSLRTNCPNNSLSYARLIRRPTTNVDFDPQVAYSKSPCKTSSALMFVFTSTQEPSLSDCRLRIRRSCDVTLALLEWQTIGNISADKADDIIRRRSKLSAYRGETNRQEVVIFLANRKPFSWRYSTESGFVTDRMHSSTTLGDGRVQFPTDAESRTDCDDQNRNNAMN